MAVRGYAASEDVEPGRVNVRGERVRQITTKMKSEEIMRLLLVNRTTREIAGMLRMAVGTVRDYIRDWEFQKELKEKNFGIWQRIDEEITLGRLSKTAQLDEMGERALEKMRELLESDDERIVFKAASDTLDRGKETSKHHIVEATNLNFNVPADALILAATTALEIEGNPQPYGPDAGTATPTVIEGTNDGA